MNDRLPEGRVPPFDQRAEEAVLGSALINPAAYILAAAIVQPEDFYVEANRRIWMAMGAIHNRGGTLDHVTLGAELTQAGDIEKIGGVMALDGLTDAVPTSAHAEHYAEIVRSLASRRRMIYVAQQIVADGFSAHEDTDGYLAAASTAVAQVVTGAAHRRQSATFAQLSAELFEQLSAKEENTDLIQIGLGGIAVPRGVLSILAGRPSNGKSAAALNIACNVARQGTPVAVFAIEDTRHAYIARGAARHARISLQNIIERKLDMEEWPRMTGALEAMSRLPITIYDNPRVTAQWIRQASAVLQQRQGLDLVIVDYVQLMQAPGAPSAQERIAEAALGLAQLARELNVAVLLVSQIRRPDNVYKDKVPPPPNLDMLKGSGVLEETARCVILLHYPHHYNEEEEETYLWCRIAKHTNGRVGQRRLACNMEQMWIGDPDLAQQDPTEGRY